MPGPGRPPDEGMVLNNRPQAYIDRYKEQNYLVRDPLVTELRKSVHPYTWGDIRQRRKLTKTEARIMDEGRDFGVREGIIIPIVTLSGSLSVFSPFRDRADRHLQPTGSQTGVDSRSARRSRSRSVNSA